MYLCQLQLTAYKGFKDFTLTLSPLSTIVGLNNSGKTSILQAIGLLHDILGYAFDSNQLNSAGLPLWQSNATRQIRRLGYVDTSALWLSKKTSVPCQVSAEYTNGYAVELTIASGNNYTLDILRQGESIKQEVLDKGHQAAIADIIDLKPTFVPPVSTVSPIEKFVYHNQLNDQIDQGQFGEVWRNRIYWLRNDGREEDFELAVEMVSRYLPSIHVLNPKLTHDNPPRVSIEYEEEGVFYDIGMSGSGLRTLLGMGVVLQMTESKCLLLDEPDSHLHSNLQKALAKMLVDFSLERDIQIINATHSPDYIREMPLESLTWIDRKSSSARSVANIGRILVDLGAIDSFQAIGLRDIRNILFVEGGLDSEVLSKLLHNGSLYNPFQDPSVFVTELPNGRGDSQHLDLLTKVLGNAIGSKVNVACIIDNDYGLMDLVANPGSISSPLLMAVNRKEIENYFLDATTIHRALEMAADKRADATGDRLQIPSVETIAEQVLREIDRPENRNMVMYHVLPRYREGLDKKYDMSTREERAIEWFQQSWHNESWKIANSPGKKILKALREWCQKEYSLTVSNRLLIESLPETPTDIVTISEQLHALFIDQRSE